MTTERLIHFTAFILLIVGLFGIVVWAGYAYLQNDLLKLASIALMWGLILIILYITFEKLGWRWWS